MFVYVRTLLFSFVLLCCYMIVFTFLGLISVLVYCRALSTYVQSFMLVLLTLLVVDFVLYYFVFDVFK